MTKASLSEIESLYMSNPWLVTNRLKRTVDLRLFCFPFAGGGAIAYHSWAKQLPETIEVNAIRLPGREMRIGEAPITQWRPLIHQLVTALQTKLDKPFVFYGHSLGTLLAFESARELRRRGLPLPKLLVVTGREAAHMPPIIMPDLQLPEGQFIRSIHNSFGGISEAILENEELVELLEPILRADFTLVENHVFVPEEPFNFPIIACTGINDMPTQVGVQAWASHTTNSFQCHTMPGGHFFIESERGALLEIIRTALIDLTEGLGRSNF